MVQISKLLCTFAALLINNFKVIYNMKKVFLLMMFLCLALTAGADDIRQVGNLWYNLSNDQKSATVVAPPQISLPIRMHSKEK